MTHTKAKYPALPEALSKNASYYISRVIIALNHPGKKHWREKLNGCLMITDLAKSGANDEALVRQLEPLKAALNKCKAVTKPVREAAAEAIAELEKKKAESMARNEEGEEGEGGDKPEEQEVTVHDADEPPPIKFEPDYEPEITGGGGGGVEDDDDDDSVVSPTRDGAGYRGKKGESLESVKKKGRKAKYAHQRVAGGVRSPRENETASGSAHATVRMLKELGNKSVALQRSLDDMARGVGDKMDNIGRRVKNLEVEVVGGGGGGGGGGGVAGRKGGQPQVRVQISQKENSHQNDTNSAQQQQQQPPDPKQQFFQSKGIDINQPVHNPQVSLWREIQWLLHTGEFETAYQAACNANDKMVLLRLMNETSCVVQRLGVGTQNKVFGMISEIMAAGQQHDLHVLPWIFEVVRLGGVKNLAPFVRDGLSKALFNLTSDPDEKGVLAAQLHPRVAM